LWRILDELELHPHVVVALDQQRGVAGRPAVGDQPGLGQPPGFEPGDACELGFGVLDKTGLFGGVSDPVSVPVGFPGVPTGAAGSLSNRFWARVRTSAVKVRHAAEAKSAQTT
jgi:hypothetical protein